MSTTNGFSADDGNNNNNNGKHRKSDNDDDEDSYKQLVTTDEDKFFDVADPQSDKTKSHRLQRIADKLIRSKKMESIDQIRRLPEFNDEHFGKITRSSKKYDREYMTECFQDPAYGRTQISSGHHQHENHRRYSGAALPPPPPLPFEKKSQSQCISDNHHHHHHQHHHHHHHHSNNGGCPENDRRRYDYRNDYRSSRECDTDEGHYNTELKEIQGKHDGRDYEVRSSSSGPQDNFYAVGARDEWISYSKPMTSGYNKQSMTSGAGKQFVAPSSGKIRIDGCFGKIMRRENDDNLFRAKAKSIIDEASNSSSSGSKIGNGGNTFDYFRKGYYNTADGRKANNTADGGRKYDNTADGGRKSDNTADGGRKSDDTADGGGRKSDNTADGGRESDNTADGGRKADNTADGRKVNDDDDDDDNNTDNNGGGKVEGNQTTETSKEDAAYAQLLRDIREMLQFQKKFDTPPEVRKSYQKLLEKRLNNEDESGCGDTKCICCYPHLNELPEHLKFKPKRPPPPIYMYDYFTDEYYLVSVDEDERYKRPSQNRSG